MKTNFGLSKESCDNITKHLNQAVANNYALYLLTLQCHWNIEDPGFLFLHEMLEKQYLQLAENGDLLAERIRQMGEKVSGSIEILAQRSQLPKIEEKASTESMLNVLATCHEKAILALRELSEVGEQSKDFGLVDLLGSIVRDHEKTAWILRSHL